MKARSAGRNRNPPRRITAALDYQDLGAQISFSPDRRRQQKPRNIRICRGSDEDGRGRLACADMDEAAAAVPPDLEVLTGTEREVLEGFLELCRGVVPRKLAGLAELDARRSLVPSRTTLLGLVKHLASVEREWFGIVLGGRSPGQLGIPADDGWGPGPHDTVDGVLEDYRRACTESRAVAARFGLDETVVHPQLGSVSMRWIYVHMIEETARHAGHADILREQTDGSTGVD